MVGVLLLITAQVDTCLRSINHWQLKTNFSDYLFSGLIDFVMATGFRFRDFVPEDLPEKGFESLLKLFMQLITITSGDVSESLSWLSELDKQYGLTDDNYGMGDFIEDLKKKGYIDDDPQ